MTSENQRRHKFDRFKSPKILPTATFIFVSLVALGGLLYHLNLRISALESLLRENSLREDRLSATFATLSAMEKVNRPPFSREKFSIVRGYILQMESVVFSALHERAPAMTDLEKRELETLFSLLSTEKNHMSRFISQGKIAQNFVSPVIGNRMTLLTYKFLILLKHDRNLLLKHQDRLRQERAFTTILLLILLFSGFGFLGYLLRSDEVMIKVLTLELRLIDRLIITSSTIDNWKEPIKEMLKDINEVLDTYFLITLVFSGKKGEEIYQFDVFWCAEPSPSTRQNMESFLMREVTKREDFKGIASPQWIHTVLDSAKSLPELDRENFTFITRMLFLNQPHVGGIAGVGLHTRYGAHSVYRLVVETLLSSILNMIGSIRSIYLHKKEIEYSVLRDPLTGLPNRRVFLDRIEQIRLRSGRTGERFAVGILDLDGFKGVNDRLGHPSGDELLIHVAERLGDLLRKTDTLARLGGDEFGLLLTGLKDEKSSRDLFTRIVESLLDPFDVGNGSGEPVRISGSLGVALCPPDHGEATSLIAHADLALYRVKDHGRNGWAVFEIGMEESLLEQHRIRTEFARALENGEICLYYQPQVDMETGQVVGVEALVRWNHPKRGLLTPRFFIEEVEKSDLIFPLGRWALDTAMLQQEDWFRLGFNLRVSVNIGARHFLSDGFVESLTEMLVRHERPEHLVLEVEVTETEALRDLEKARKTIDECRNLGISVSLDDFGTGQASLISLQQLDIKEVKIDIGFVRRMTESQKDLAIVSSLSSAARMMMIEVVAEGVETEEQGVLLLRMGCRVAQGYVIARAMPPSMIPEWASKWKPFESWGRQERGKNGGFQDDTLLMVGQSMKVFLKGILVGLETPGAMKEEWTDPRECVLGQWIEHTGRIRYGGTPEFDKLERIRDKRHSLVQEALSARDRNDTEMLERLKSELTEVSLALQKALQDLLG